MSYIRNHWGPEYLQLFYTKSFIFYVQVSDPFWVNLYMVRQGPILFIFLACDYPVVWTPFVKKTIHSPIELIDTINENQL